MILVCLSHAFKKCPVFFFQFKQLINGLLPWLWLVACLVTDTSFTDLEEFGWKLRDPLFFAYFKKLLIHCYTQLHVTCQSFVKTIKACFVFNVCCKHITNKPSPKYSTKIREQFFFYSKFIPQNSGCFFRSKKNSIKKHTVGKIQWNLIHRVRPNLERRVIWSSGAPFTSL